MITNIIIFIAIVGMGMVATYKWGAAKSKGKVAEKINKGNEDANKTRNKVRLDTKFRKKIRDMFDAK